MPVNKACPNSWATFCIDCSCQHPPPLLGGFFNMLGLEGFFMSGICAFLGHRDTIISFELEERLKQTIKELIYKGYNEFWCCDQGNFDWIVRKVLLEIKKENRLIYVCYVSAYNPDKFAKMRLQWLEEHFEIIYPNEAADGPQRFAIKRRNKYIIENADIFVCYVEYETGGAYTALKFAQKLDKKIINLAKQKGGSK